MTTMDRSCRAAISAQAVATGEISMTRDYAGRARQEFRRAAKIIADDDLNRIFADQAAKGRAQSGSTVIIAVGAFEDCSRTALQNLQTQFSSQLEGRGREWRCAMEALDSALADHIHEAPEILSQAIKVATGNLGPGPAPTEGGVVTGFRDLVAKVAERLNEEQQAYHDLWTAPRGKTWIERNKFKYGIAAAVGGVVLAKGGDLFFAWLTR